MCTSSQSEECFATKLGFRVGITIAFGILVTAIICNIQVSVYNLNLKTLQKCRNSEPLTKQSLLLDDYGITSQYLGQGQ